MAFRGSCFCKAFSFNVKVAPQKLSECNCTFCTKRGVIWSYHMPDDIEITVTDAAVWKTEGGAEHYFCAICGCTTFSRTPTYEQKADGGFTTNPDRIGISIHARLFDDLDWRFIPAEKIDGRHLW